MKMIRWKRNRERMKETKNNSWLCEIQAPPELHESIEQFFNALSYKIRHADGWMDGYKYGLKIGESFIRCKDCAYYDECFDGIEIASFCRRQGGLESVCENDYCSKAERKKE